MAVVHLYAGLRKIAGAQKFIVEGERIDQILANLTELAPAIKPILMDEGKIREYVTIAVNGHNINLIGGLGLKVTPDDEIAIFPPLAGG